MLLRTPHSRQNFGGTDPRPASMDTSFLAPVLSQGNVLDSRSHVCTCDPCVRMRTHVSMRYRVQFCPCKERILSPRPSILLARKLCISHLVLLPLLKFPPCCFPRPRQGLPRKPALGCGPGTPGPCRSLALGPGPRTGIERWQVRSLPFRASTGEAAGRRVPGLCSSPCLGPSRGRCWAKAVRKTSAFPGAADHGPFAHPPPGPAQGPALAAQRGGRTAGASQCFSSPCSRARTSERRSLRARNGRF